MTDDAIGTKRSKINPMLTLEYMTTEAENKYFDRKSAKIKPSDIADLISAFSNADGGTIVIGVSDKTKRIEGINQFGEEKINGFINAPKDFCKPLPIYEDEFINVVNHAGEEDRILLLHIHMSPGQIICTNNDSVYLRIGDKTKEIKGRDLRSLEYSKSIRHYEDECSFDAKVGDLDADLLERYKNIIGAEHLSYEQVLKARGFIKEVNGESRLTNAAVLLFAENIQQFYPNCRVRFVRYEGDEAKVGEKINIVKDINVEYSILKIIDEAKKTVSAQLREFTALDRATGKFKNVPEYPEFAWLEGIVNAVAHREYGMSGSYIRVTMYDDRLEIESPGKLPSPVTIKNIQNTRYSRNPRISRVLTEFGWVRELNEGVKRIYSDMNNFFLDDPVYSEPENSVKLVLKNNIIMRSIRWQDKVIKNIGIDAWFDIDELEKEILVYMGSRSSVSRAELVEFTGKATRTVAGRLNDLIDKQIICRKGKKNDPKQRYEFL